MTFSDQTLRSVWTSIYLRCRGDVAPRQTNIWCPSDIAHPVGMSFERLFFNPRLRVFAETPDFDEIIAPRANEPFESSRRVCSWLLWVGERARLGTRSPRYGIASYSMGIENVCAPFPIICGVRAKPHSQIQSTHGGIPLKVRTEIFPSEEAQARVAPSS